MCRNNTYYAKKAEHINRFHLESELFDDSDGFNPRWRIVAGYDKQPIIVRNTVEGRNESINAHWGIFPSWVYDPAQAKKESNKYVNSRAETVFESRMYKDLIATKRCLVCSTGFYEYHHRGKEKIAFYIKDKQQEIFSIAGIYTIHKSGMIGFSMVTRAANTLLRHIHNAGDNPYRIPTVLNPEMESLWTDPATPITTIKEILAHEIPDSRITAWPVDSPAKRNKVDGPEMLTPIEVEGLDWRQWLAA